jgi:hypothetical protein
MLFTNFNFNKLMGLWDKVTDDMIKACSGQGRNKIRPFNAFFLLLYHYKRGKEPDTLALEFQSMWGTTTLS